MKEVKIVLRDGSEHIIPEMNLPRIERLHSDDVKDVIYIETEQDKLEREAIQREIAERQKKGKAAAPKRSASKKPKK